MFEYSKNFGVQARRFGHQSMVMEMLEEEAPRVFYPHTLEIPIGIDSANDETVFLDLTGDTNKFICCVGQTRSGKTYLANNIASRMCLYGKYCMINLADVKNENYDQYVNVFDRLQPNVRENENPKGEKFDFDYYAFMRDENDSYSIPSYIPEENRIKLPETLELNAYRTLADLNQLGFIKNLGKRIPVFCFGAYGSDDVNLSHAIAWLIERIHSYAKWKNNYGANIKSRILLFGDEASRYSSERGGKAIKEGKKQLEDIASRGASQGIAGLFMSQRFSGMSTSLRNNIRYRILCIGASQEDKDNILREAGITDKYQKNELTNLEYNSVTGEREYLLVDNMAGTCKKFRSFSPLFRANPIV